MSARSKRASDHDCERLDHSTAPEQSPLKKQKKKRRQTSPAWDAFVKVSLHGVEFMECLLCAIDPPIYLPLLGSTTVSMLTHLQQRHPAELVQLMNCEERVVPPRAERTPMFESFVSPICQNKLEDSVLELVLKTGMGLRTVESKNFFHLMNGKHRRAVPVNAATLPRKVT